MSFRRRLTVLVTGAVALTGAVVIVSLYLIVQQQLRGQVEDELDALVERVAAAVEASGNGSLPAPRGSQARSPNLVNIPRIVDADGDVVDSLLPEVRLPVTSQARAVAAERRDSSFEIVESGSRRFAIATVRVSSDRAVQVARSLEPVDDVLARLLRASLIAGGVAVLLAPLIAHLVVGGALVPVRRLSRTARRVARTADLAQRAEARGDDELASLATSFNTMLDRLEDVVDELERTQQAQRRLVADASHELRTPLTTLRANVELLALDDGMTDDERAELADDTTAQIDDLTALMSQLIDLAREDDRQADRSPTRLDEVVRDAIDRTRPRYPDVSFTAELEPTVVIGTRDALSRAVRNLLDNAGEWSPATGTVEVTLEDGVLEVRDHGPGIDEDDMPHVFQRFYRGTQSRGRPGSGLGLAIVSQVVASHGGRAWAEAAPGGGASFKMRVPPNEG